MPPKSKKPCAHPGCSQLVQDGRYCIQHKRQDRQRYDKERGSASQRGYNYRWQQYSKRYLAEHPLCVQCHNEGRIVAAQVTDHIQPHKGDQGLF
ncbi:MAG: HNH endonuclease, partial [Syntrophomonadaceae bacterium]|nr:HNH endonuclease [Syntrophomonadaceae bacterium]